SPPPICAIMASTVSPTANCSSRNTPTRIRIRVGIEAASRSPARPRMRIAPILSDKASGGKPKIVPACRAPARRIGMIACLGRNDSDKNLLDRHPDRQLRVHFLDELGIERLALGRIDFGRGIIDGLVDRLVFPAPLVGPGRALGLAGAIPHRGRDGGIVAVLVPAGGEIE